MAALTQQDQQDVRKIVREETSGQFAELRKSIRDTDTKLSEKMDFMLGKMDGFLKGLEDEKDERISGDALLERRIEHLEQQA